MVRGDQHTSPHGLRQVVNASLAQPFPQLRLVCWLAFILALLSSTRGSCRESLGLFHYLGLVFIRCQRQPLAVLSGQPVRIGRGLD